MLVTTVNEVRRYLDGALGSLILTRDPARSGDYLCADGRYRLGDVEGVARPQKRSQSLIGVVRRQAAAAARREELSREQSTVQRELEQTRAAHALERDAATQAEQRARALAEVAHMLDEVEQRRIEMRALREAEEQSSVRLAAAGREVDASALEEEDARQRWTDATTSIPGAGESGEPDTRAPRGLAGGRRLHRAVGRDTQPPSAVTEPGALGGGRSRRGG